MWAEQTVQSSQHQVNGSSSITFTNLKEDSWLSWLITWGEHQVKKTDHLALPDSARGVPPGSGGPHRDREVWEGLATEIRRATLDPGAEKAGKGRAQVSSWAFTTRAPGTNSLVEEV